MRAGATRIDTSETGIVARKAQPFFNHESGEHSFFKPRTAFIQPQLTIGAANDSYEQEADAMADKAVHRMKDPSVSTPNIQKKCADCEEKNKMQRKEMGKEEEKLQRKEVGEEDELQRKAMGEEDELQRKAMGEEDELQRKEADEKEEMPLMRKADGGGFTASPNLTSQLGSSKGGGSPLPDGTRQGMESAFDTDFSQVRVHTGTQAADMSQGIQAHAFTHGSDVYFNNGQYSPNTEGGQRLLAHELTHVVQQGGSIQPKIQRGWFSNAVNAVGNAVSGAVSSVGNAVSGAASSVGNAVSSAASWVGNTAASAASAIGGAASSLWGQIASGASWLGGQMWRGMSWFGSKLWSGLSWLGNAAWDAVKWVGNYLYRVGESAVGYIWALVTEFPERFWRLIKHIGIGLFYDLPIWAWDGVVKLFRGDWSGLWSWLKSGLAGGAAWIGRLIAKIFDLVGVGELLDFIFTVIKVNTRRMTGTEEAEARKVFGNSIDYWRVRIDEFSLIAYLGNLFGGSSGGGMGVTTFHTINFNKSINAQPCNSDMAWLIHELTHVAQMEHVGMQYLGEAVYALATTRYEYGGGAGLVGKSFGDFNREQQGDITSDYYEFVLCSTSPHPNAADYQRIISQVQRGQF